MVLAGRDSGGRRKALFATDDGELWTTQTETEKNVFVDYLIDVLGASTEWALLIDRDSNDWPHDKPAERIDISLISLAIDKTTNALGSVAIGVITRIDGTNADVTFFFDAEFANSSGNNLQFFRNFAPSQLKCGVDGNGNTSRILSSDRALNVTALNTATQIQSPVGNRTPAVGDIVARGVLSAGTSFRAEIELFYHSEG